MEITVLNWEKYNPRSDRMVHSWFRMNHDMIFSTDFYGIDRGSFYFFIYVLSCASRSHERGSFTLNYDQATRVLGMKKTEIESGLKFLQEKHIITIRDTAVTPPRHRRDTAVTPYDTKRNETSMQKPKIQKHQISEKSTQPQAELVESYFGVLDKAGISRPVATKKLYPLASRLLEQRDLETLKQAIVLWSKDQFALDKGLPFELFFSQENIWVSRASPPKRAGSDPNAKNRQGYTNQQLKELSENAEYNPSVHGLPV